jgi:hypothetical protein
MNKYKCAVRTGGCLYDATVVATNEQHASELAASAANDRWPRYGLSTVKWNIAQLQSKVRGPARVVDLTYR